jgi:hypothetical protein
VTVLSWSAIRRSLRPRLTTIGGGCAGGALAIAWDQSGALSFGGLAAFVAAMALLGDFPRTMGEARSDRHPLAGPMNGRGLVYGAAAPAIAWFAAADVFVVLIRASF